MRQLLLLAVVLLSGCKPNESKPSDYYLILVVDGCEYIAFDRSYASPLHKANCTNHVER